MPIIVKVGVILDALVRTFTSESYFRQKNRKQPAPTAISTKSYHGI